MKLYLYTTQYDKIKKEGYKSLSMFDKASDHYKQALLTHKRSAKSEDFSEIETYLKNTFAGRLRAICGITEIAPFKEYKHPYLNYLVHFADVISFDIEQLLKDKIVEAIYCKDLRKTILESPEYENIYQIDGVKDIDKSPHDWDLCGEEKYRPYSPWATIKHYMLVLTSGYIPPEYITLEIDHSKEREALSSIS